MIVCGTGHRPFQTDPKTKESFSKLEFEGHGRFSKELYQRLVALARAWLRAHPEVDTVISGMAMGWDIALAVAAIKEGRTLHAYVPYVKHGQWKSFWGDLHETILLDLPEDQIFCGAQEFSKEALLQRNRDMVDAADMVLALWDGTHGGTAHCVKYATEQGKPVVNLWNNWLRHRVPIDTQA